MGCPAGGGAAPGGAARGGAPPPPCEGGGGKEGGFTLPAVIDDMAQIVGPTCRTVDGKEAAAKELKKRNSCLIKGDGAVTTGRTLNEAFTCMMVLQKAAICFVSASVLGGNVVINGFEARLMRFVYKKKYSKINTENNMEREGK